MHLVFHVSLLKPYHGDNTQPSTDVPPIFDDGALVLQPQRILDQKWTTRGGKMSYEILVQWKNLPPEDATWELAEIVFQQFPDIELEDKLNLEVVGIDKVRRSNRERRPNLKYLG